MMSARRTELLYTTNAPCCGGCGKPSLGGINLCQECFNADRIRAAEISDGCAKRDAAYLQSRLIDWRDAGMPVWAKL